MKSFQDAWAEHYGAVLPLGWALRAAVPFCWFRVHTLPGSKRRSDTDAERAEVLRRQVALAKSVLGHGRPCWVVAATWGEKDLCHLRPEDLAALFPGIAFGPGFLMADLGDAGRDPIPFRAARTTWTPAAFERALAEVDDDYLVAVWLADDGSVFAPYDGGIDLFVRPRRRREALEQRFADWLPDE